MWANRWNEDCSALFFLPHPNEWFKDQNLITSLYHTKWIIRSSGYRLQRKSLQQSQEQEDLWTWSQRILSCGALESPQSHNCFQSLLIGEVAQCTGLRAESEHCWKMLGPGSDSYGISRSLPSYSVSLSLSFPTGKWRYHNHLTGRVNESSYAKHLEKDLEPSKSYTVPTMYHLGRWVWCQSLWSQSKKLRHLAELLIFSRTISFLSVPYDGNSIFLLTSQGCHKDQRN